MDLSPLSVVIRRALAKARDVISEVTGCPVDITSPSIELLSAEQLPGLFGAPEEPVVAAYVGFGGDLSGHAFVMFDTESTARIIATVLGPEKTDSEMAVSLMAEIGNVTCSTVINTIADCAGICITPLPPDVALDMSGALLESVAGALAASADEVLVVRTHLKVFDQQSHGYFVYIPERKCLERLVRLLEGTGCAI